MMELLAVFSDDKRHPQRIWIIFIVVLPVLHIFSNTEKVCKPWESFQRKYDIVENYVPL